MRSIALSSLVLLAIAAGCAGRAPGDRAARAGTAALAVPADGAEACAGCHAAEAAEWRGSLHRHAFDDADFQTSFALEPADFCFRCHAPEARSRADRAGAAIGIGCRSCHEVASVAPAVGHPAAVGDAAAEPAAPAGHAGHAPMGTRPCAGCHEFTFPAAAALMQSTATEHARSPLADVACAACHARPREGHRDHRFDVTRNPAFLRGALAVDARRTAGGLAVALRTDGVGHAMPTGDLFRRLRVVVRAEDAAGASLGEDEAILGRRFARGHGAPTELRDDRVFGARTVTFEGDWLVRAAAVVVEVRYERVAHTDDGDVAERPAERHEALFASVPLSTVRLGAGGPTAPETRMP